MGKYIIAKEEPVGYARVRARNTDNALTLPNGLTVAVDRGAVAEVWGMEFICGVEYVIVKLPPRKKYDRDWKMWKIKREEFQAKYRTIWRRT